MQTRPCLAPRNRQVDVHIPIAQRWKTYTNVSRSFAGNRHTRLDEGRYAHGDNKGYAALRLHAA
jgi:hypothetical protein